jgi:hypothetical protein
MSELAYIQRPNGAFNHAITMHLFRPVPSQGDRLLQNLATTGHRCYFNISTSLEIEF